MSDTSRLTPGRVTLTNWRNSGDTRWVLRNFNIMPGAVVARGREAYDLKPGTARDFENFTYEHEGQTHKLGQAMQDECVDGYLVIQNGEVLFERYFDNFRDHDHHLWASMTKSLISTAYGIAAAEFGIDETKTPADYVPQLAGGVFGAVSIRDVLNMVTALNYSEEYEDMAPGSVHYEYFRRLGFAIDYELMAIDPRDSNEARGVRDMLPQFQQRDDGVTGAVYEYQSPNVDVIGWLIESVTGQALRDYVRDKIWAPLGTDHDGIFSVDVSFAPISTGGFNSTLRDAARFGLMALGNGSLGDKKIAPENWMKDTYHLNEADLAAGAKSINGDPTHAKYFEGFSGYRSFWWNFDQQMGERQAMGVHGQVIYVNQAKNLVIATFASPEQTANMLRPSFKTMLAGTRALARSL